MFIKIKTVTIEKHKSGAIHLDNLYASKEEFINNIKEIWETLGKNITEKEILEKYKGRVFFDVKIKYDGRSGLYKDDVLKAIGCKQQSDSMLPFYSL